MNRKIGIYSSLINVSSVAAFSLCMIIDSYYYSFLVCMFIAFSFIPIICAFSHYCNSDKKVAGNIAIAFASIYAVIIFIVYYAQVTTVAFGNLDDQVSQIIDYSKFGLFFNYDLFGYGIMSLATFFAGLTINIRSNADIWLKWLLIIHGAFFVGCFIMPMLGLFGPNTQGADWIGFVVLEFWCIYFIPIGVLSFIHFKKKTE
ncbi:MAG: hypothetical protein IT233_04275 [Bacteroidia bacterium]|nr:hypothetical protein [Bacteroidia bacterium]